MACFTIDKGAGPSKLFLITLLSHVLGYAWINRFVLDDAFISLRYAKNFAEGHGLVWNVGQRIEGYTNFLWTVLLAPAFKLGVDPVNYSYTLSLLAFLATLFFSYKLASEMWGDKRAGVAVLCLLGFNFSFSSYATGGLETQFGIAMMLGAIWSISKAASEERLWWSFFASVFTVCSIMTRMDSILLIAPFSAILVAQANGKRDLDSLKRLLLYGLCVMIPLVVWMALRKSYYGDWVPNTFHIKTHGCSFVRGGYYQLLFYCVYALFLPFFVALFKLKSVYAACVERREALLIIIAVALWSLYLLRVGGGFMEFRLMMPAYALLAILLAGLWSAFSSKFLKIGLAFILALASLSHAAIQYKYPAIQSISDLKQCESEWSEVGLLLGKLFDYGGEKVCIGVTAAGVIPFYSNLPAFDLLGLNNREVALSGNQVTPVSRWLGTRPGHARVADWLQVLNAGVDLIINHPWIVSERKLLEMSRSEVLQRWDIGIGFDEKRIYHRFVKIPEREIETKNWPKVVAWPIHEGKYLITIYVKPNNVVERAIVNGKAAILKE